MVWLSNFNNNRTL